MSTYATQIKKNFSFANIISTYIIVFLPIFTFGIFGPSEIFFANHLTFGIIFDEFGWFFLKSGVCLALFITFFTLFLPNKFQKSLLCILWIFSLCGYLQTMFLNKHLDQIGATTAGYIPTTSTIVKNTAIWIAIIGLAIFIIYISKANWKKTLSLTAFILVATQIVAYGTLFFTTSEDAFIYKESDLYLSGEKQYTVSSEENVIVFILDTVANNYYDRTLAVYPEMADYLSDFTYYTNTDCNYYGTFPSIPHIITGHDFDPTQKVNDWLYDCWNNDATTRLYNELHENNYQINVYSVEPVLFTGSHSLSLVDGKIDNLTSDSQNREVNHDLLYKTLLTMSCYRFMPDYFKPHFDVPNTEYASIVTYPDNKINYTNPDFYADLLEKGISTDDSSKYVIFYHLNGIHELINDENCMPVSNSDDAWAAIKGIWVLLDEYLQQLRSAGVYDNSTIIITADHGSIYDNQSIFFIKEKDERYPTMRTTNAPITLDELLPTVAEITTGSSEYLGHTIYDFSENQKRERTYYVREFDDSYPLVNRFDGTPNLGSNIYKLYTYTGDYYDYVSQYENYQFTVVEAADAYY